MKKCPNCNRITENENFCTVCGSFTVDCDAKPNVIACRFCGTALGGKAKFCHVCGKPVGDAPQPEYTSQQANTTQPPTENASPYASYAESANPNGGAYQSASQTAETQAKEKSFSQKVKDKLYDMAGESDEVHIKLSDLFTNVFKKHSSEESENLFICGTKKTTPELKSINTSWPRPWVYSRIFAVMLLSSLLMYLCIDLFKSLYAIPGLIIFGSFAVPLTCLFFFFEINAPQNISFYRMLQYFLIGGCLSLFVTFILYTPFGDIKLTYVGAAIVSIVEEAGKMVIVAAIIAKEKPKYRLNGIVIGAAIGAGFASLESAGYAFSQLLQSNISYMYKTIMVRGLLAPGGHIVWAAISGYAIMLAMDGGNFSMRIFKSGKFWRLFAIPLVLHAIWDMPFDILSEIYGKMGILVVACWCVVLVLISAGLQQVNNIINSSKEALPEDITQNLENPNT